MQPRQALRSWPLYPALAGINAEFRGGSVEANRAFRFVAPVMLCQFGRKDIQLRAHARELRFSGRLLNGEALNFTQQSFH